MVKFGIYEKALLSDDIEESLKEASQAGYSFWEMSIDPQKKDRLNWGDEQILSVKRICERTNMSIYNIVLSLNREYPLGAYDEDISRQGALYLKQAIDLAVKLGVRTVQIAGYYTLEEESDSGSKEQYAKNIIPAVRYAEANGVMLGIENVDRDLVSMEDILDIVLEINSPFLKIYPDCGNFTGNGLDPIQELEIGRAHIVGLHLKDTKYGVYRRVNFGEGEVNFNSLLNYLKEKGLDNYYGIEMWSDDHPNAMVDVKKAIEYIKNNM